MKPGLIHASRELHVLDGLLAIRALAPVPWPGSYLGVVTEVLDMFPTPISRLLTSPMMKLLRDRRVILSPRALARPLARFLKCPRMALSALTELRNLRVLVPRFPSPLTLEVLRPLLFPVSIVLTVVPAPVR